MDRDTYSVSDTSNLLSPLLTYLLTNPTHLSHPDHHLSSFLCRIGKDSRNRHSEPNRPNVFESRYFYEAFKQGIFFGRRLEPKSGSKLTVIAGL